MVKIQDYFLINEENFDVLIESTNVNLSKEDSNYLSTLIEVNFFAYFAILLTLWIVFTMCHKILPKRRFKS